MSAERPLKKSETLEIRLDHQAKAAFMARCQAEGVTASEALRGFIAGRQAAGRRPTGRFGWLQALAAAIAGLAIGAAAPSVAQSFGAASAAAADRAAFQALDRNQDGVLSLNEFTAR